MTLKNQGWTNRLQLPNPGVVDGMHRHIHGGEVLSIAEVEKGDFREVGGDLMPIEATDIELNLSCPNLGKITCRGILQDYVYAKGFQRMVHCKTFTPDHARTTGISDR